MKAYKDNSWLYYSLFTILFLGGAVLTKLFLTGDQIDTESILEFTGRNKRGGMVFFLIYTPLRFLTSSYGYIVLGLLGLLFFYWLLKFIMRKKADI